MIPRVCPAQQSLEGERREAGLQDCQSRPGGAAGGTPGRTSALPQPAHLPRDGAAGRRGAAVLAEAGGGAAGGEHLGGGGRLAACPLPPQESRGEVSFIDLQVGPSLDCVRESQ